MPFGAKYGMQKNGVNAMQILNPRSLFPLYH